MIMKKTEKNNPPLYTLITAAGSSTRMGGSVKKEYLPLDSGTVLSTVLKNFISFTDTQLVVITVPENSKNSDSIKEAEEVVYCDKKLLTLLETKTVKIIFTEGSSTRQASVYKGLKALKDNLTDDSFTRESLVAIHDGARPFITEDLIKRTIEKACETGAAFPGLEPTETQKQICPESGNVLLHLKRKELISVQTPQIFSFNKIFEAHALAEKDGAEYTDDTEIYSRYCGQVAAVKGIPENIKITYPDDYKNKKDMQNIIHTGLGYDMHRLIEGRKLMLGGVHLPFEKGEDGHSDGDVLLHAITDALLGASGLGDIGSYFPPEEPEWKDADSAILLKTVWKDVKSSGWELGNLDCVIKMERPKFLPYRQEVINSIANILDVSPECIFVKAKTYEKTGNWENQIESWVTCLLTK